MPRPHRETPPGSLHHVSNRGIAKGTIFGDDDDRRYFLSRIAREVRRSSMALHAFSLMGNHYHLLIESRDGDLGAAMSRMTSPFVRRFNRKMGRDGPLCNARYWSKHVRDDRYLVTLIHYIESNPQAAALHRGHPAWRFCSRHLRHPEERPRWLSPPNAARDAGWRPPTSSLPDLEWVIRRTFDVGGHEAPHWPADTDRATVADWLRERGDRARKRETCAPVVSPRSVRQSLDRARRERPEWRVAFGARTACGYRLLETGLLSELCQLETIEVGQELGRDRSTIYWRLRSHATALERDEEYREMHLSAAAAAIAQVLGETQGRPRPDVCP